MAELPPQRADLPQDKRALRQNKTAARVRKMFPRGSSAKDYLPPLSCRTREIALSRALASLNIPENLKALSSCHLLSGS